MWRHSAAVMLGCVFSTSLTLFWPIRRWRGQDKWVFLKTNFCLLTTLSPNIDCLSSSEPTCMGPLHFDRESAGCLFHLYRYQGLSKVTGKNWWIFQHVSKLHKGAEWALIPRKKKRTRLSLKENHPMQPLTVASPIRHIRRFLGSFLEMWSGTNPVKSQGHLSRQGLSSGMLEGTECQNYKSNCYCTWF